MSSNPSRSISIVPSAAFLVLALIGTLQVYAQESVPNSFAASITPTFGVNAQADDSVILLYSSLPGGIARGETLRVTLTNLIRLEGRDQNPVEVRAQMKLFDAQARIIGQTGEVAVQQNQFRSFEFNRDQLALPGETGTGRLQVRSELTVRCIGVNKTEAMTISQGAFLPASSEVIGNATGESQSLNPCLPMSVWLQAQPGSNPNSIGLTYGRTLRFSALNPIEAGRSSGPIRVRIRLADIHGNVIRQSAEFIIPAGTFQSFDFNRSALSLPGEPGTGRLQLAWSVEAFTSETLSRKLTVSIETVDNTSGVSTTTVAGYVYVAVPLQQ